jgi:hypothetical protein
MNLVFAPASAARSICVFCGELIDRAEPRLASAGFAIRSELHVECARLRSPYELPQDWSPLDRWGAALEPQIRLRRASMEAQFARRKVERGRALQKLPALPSMERIEPLTDRARRPVVRLYADLSSSVWWLDERTRPQPLALRMYSSPRRTYRVELRPDQPAPYVEDPAIPTVGALFVVHTTVKLSIARARGLEALRAHGVPTPLLWIVGDDLARSADAEASARQWLARAGFAADDAVAVHSPVATSETLAAVLVAADESLVHTFAPPLALERRAPSVSPAAELFTIAVAESDDETARQLLLVALAETVDAVTDAHRALARAAVASLSRPALRDKALALCARALEARDADPLVAWVDAAEPASRSFTKELELACRTLVTLGRSEVGAALLRAFVRTKSLPNARRIASLLVETSRADLADELRTWATTANTDPRAKLARELLPKWRGRIARAR